MKKLSRNKLGSLLEYRSERCTTVIVPISDPGEARSHQKNTVTLKNTLKNAYLELKASSLPPEGIRDYLHPFSELIEDRGAWETRDKSLIIFRAGELFEYYSIPNEHTPFAMVAGNFYLRPLIGAWFNNRDFHLLTVSFDKGALYTFEDGKFTGNKISDDPELPGEDDNQTTLQHRSVSTEGGKQVGIFHGHGGEKDKKEKDKNQVLQIIDSHASDVLKNDNRPVILAGPEESLSKFRQISILKNLLNATIPGNYDQTNPKHLLEECQNIYQDHKNKILEEKYTQFRQALHQTKGGTQPEEIIRAAMEGKISDLFLAKDKHIWGLYNAERNVVEKHKIRQLGDNDLLDMAAAKTFETGGEVHIIDKEEMPQEEMDMAAIFRY